MNWRATLADAVLATAVAALSAATAVPISNFQSDATRVDAVGYALMVVACSALVVRRIRPMWTLAISTGAVSVYLLAGYPFGPVLLSVAIGVYSVVLARPVRRAALAAGAALVVLLTHVVFSVGTAEALAGLVPGSAWIVVPFAIGTVVRLNRQAVVRERAAEARRAADDERLRVAQEVHDVVGHGLAAITMQADIALHLLPTKPEQAETALTAISETSREALEELRATLAVLRDSTERAPTAGLARLDALTERIAASGTPVRTVVNGTARPLPPSADLVAYRVVQESLTNVLRHAGPATATVRVDYGADSVLIEVTDTGSGGAGPVDEGHGIAGMRERVTAVGGSFDAGPDTRGFRVTAKIPTP
ncbi:sensor histidine kinase [Cryptosporangium aurantiacum]|uniref:histidine kinase n=1 Tax=Cryptosporangium aurantiacum TaxID=134849 RepID=A0A1M7MNV6_9ACTN|nr:sensor histidine kinase [Cryptosporangium aurantiacum]SHM92688.1 Signal transduction histidine kinase [Cryptosporangium aurantiacum]